MYRAIINYKCPIVDVSIKYIKVKYLWVLQKILPFRDKYSKIKASKKEKFEKIYREKYIGKNPTKSKNKYYILKFNFPEINTTFVK